MYRSSVIATSPASINCFKTITCSSVISLISIGYIPPITMATNPYTDNATTNPKVLKEFKESLWVLDPMIWGVACFGTNTVVIRTQDTNSPVFTEFKDEINRKLISVVVGDPWVKYPTPK